MTDKSAMGRRNTGPMCGLARFFDALPPDTGRVSMTIPVSPNSNEGDDK